MDKRRVRTSIHRNKKGETVEVYNGTDVMNEIESIKKHFDDTKDKLNKRFTSKVEKLQSVDDPQRLPPTCYVLSHQHNQ